MGEKIDFFKKYRFGRHMSDVKRREEHFHQISSLFDFQIERISPGKIKKNLMIENQIEKKHDPAN